ncbi:MAG: hypothetical protein AAF519_00580 [Bacteroidota bacterium]
MKRNTLFTLGFILFLTIGACGQAVTISNVQLSKINSVDESDGVSYELSFLISDLTSSPSIVITLNEGDQCNGFYKEYYHIKSYNQGTFMKHKGIMTKLTDSTIKLTLDLEESLIDLSKSVCIQLTSDNEVISNTVIQMLEATP